MGILDGLTPHKDIEPCKVGRTLLELNVDDRLILLDALDNEQWTSRALSHALRARGISFAVETIKQHRTRTCRCSRT